MSKKRVFFTGEQGNLATYLAARFKKDYAFEVVWSNNLYLQEHGAESVICTRKTPFGSELDIRDEKAVTKALMLAQPDIVVHTAAVVGTERCASYSLDAYEVNVLGTYNVLTAMKRLPHEPKMVYFSTTATYKPQKGPINEHCERAPQTTYGKTKYFGELLVRQMAKNYLTLLPCFVFGGKRDYTVSAIARLARNFNTGNRHVEPVYLSLENKKDYIYVSDFIEAAYQIISKGATGEYNISGGRPMPFGEVFREILSHGAMNCEINPELDYLGEHIVDNTKLLKAIPKWKPVVSLEEGIRRVFDDDSKE